MALQDSTSLNMSLRASFDKKFLTLSQQQQQQQQEEEEEERGRLYDLLSQVKSLEGVDSVADEVDSVADFNVSCRCFHSSVLNERTTAAEAGRWSWLV